MTSGGIALAASLLVLALPGCLDPCNSISGDCVNYVGARGSATASGSWNQSALHQALIDLGFQEPRVYERDAYAREGRLDVRLGVRTFADGSASLVQVGQMEITILSKEDGKYPWLSGNEAAKRGRDLWAARGDEAQAIADRIGLTGFEPSHGLVFEVAINNA